MNITTKNNLITKAGHNHLTGEWAEKQGYFDVAVSRYYYALFQKSLFILHLKPGYVEPGGADNSHDKVIKDLYREVYPRLKDEEITWLAQFQNLKTYRRDADYKHKILTKNDFNLAFKYGYNQIAGLLDRIIGGSAQ